MTREAVRSKRRVLRERNERIFAKAGDGALLASAELGR